MATARQNELINEFISKISDNDKLLCEPVIQKLLQLNYTPKKHKKNTFAIEFVKHGRIIIKLEIGNDKLLKFWMRYSACTEYPEVFINASKLRNATWIKRG